MADTPMFVPVGAFADAESATDAAKSLVGQGIGAQPERVAEAAPEPAGDGASDAAGGPPEPDEQGETDEQGERWVLNVLAEDALRACEVLGIEPPAEVPEPEPAQVPWKAVLLVWLAALIIIPLLAFFITINVAS